MNAIPVEREIMYRVLEDALCVERERIFDDKELAKDYGAEFIDYLDIEFRVRTMIGKEVDSFRARLQQPLEATVPPYRSMPDTPARIIELIEGTRKRKK